MFPDEDVTAPLIDDDLMAFSLDGGNARGLPHPYVTLAHVGFRGAALFFYVMCGWFSDSFISSFVIVVLLLSMDFWTVKNITGRIMVGLRWWNYIDDNGKSHWVFESRKESEASRHPVNSAESNIFWIGLFLFPFFWGFMFIAAIFSFKFKWLLLVLIALVLNGSNVYGYLKCRFGTSNITIKDTISSVTSNFLREQVVTMMSPTQTNTAATNNPGTAHNVV